MMIESTFRPWKIIGLFKPDYVNTRSLKKNMKCIKRESNPRGSMATTQVTTTPLMRYYEEGQGRTKGQNRPDENIGCH